MIDTPTRVVIVDDSSVVRDRLVSLLSELAGVQVVGTAQDARQGLELVRRLEPDVVTLDIKLPDESGLVLLERIRRLDHQPVVMMLTNYPLEPYRRRCDQLGAEYFFDKTADIARLVQVLRAGVRATRVRKEEPGNRLGSGTARGGRGNPRRG